MEDWYESMSPYAKHLHINDNDGREDLHMAVGSGVTRWQQFSQWCQSLSQPLSVLVEVRTWQQLAESVRFMEREKINIFQRPIF